MELESSLFLIILQYDDRDFNQPKDFLEYGEVDTPFVSQKCVSS